MAKARELVMETLEERIALAKKTLDLFKTKLGQDPELAFSFGAQALQAQAYIRVFSAYLNEIRDSDEKISEFARKARDQVIHSALRGDGTMMTTYERARTAAHNAAMAELLLELED